MSSQLDQTLRTLQAARAKSDAILIAFSGGKDSLVVTDLCSRLFPRMAGFYMYLVPGLRVMREQFEMAEKRWGLKVREYPHWLIRRYLKTGYFCTNSYRHDDIPDWTQQHVYDLAAADTGIPIIASGAKATDSSSRRRLLHWSEGRGNVVYPIKTWHKFDVLGYLKAHAIPLPLSTGRATTGIDLTTPEVLWLHDHYPDDFEKLAEAFPHVPAIVWRREWYGVTTDTWSDSHGPHSPHPEDQQA